MKALVRLPERADNISPPRQHLDSHGRTLLSAPTGTLGQELSTVLLSCVQLTSRGRPPSSVDDGGRGTLVDMQKQI